jgi:FkbM family methyltransferase
MVRDIKWKWKCRVILYRLRLWSLLSAARLILSYWRKRPHELEFSFLANFNGREGLLVDIGANAGQSIVSSRIFNKSYSIISFEPNLLHKTDLRIMEFLFGFRKFKSYLVGLNDKKEIQKLYVPIVQGVPLSQEATLSKEGLLSDHTTQIRIHQLTGQSYFEVEETTISLNTLDDYGLHPDFVKIDVQLSELKVLKGMTRTIQKSHPILMIENGPYLNTIIQYLSTHDYKPFQYNQHQNMLQSVGEGATSMNVFFVPSERLNWLGPLVQV